MTQPYQFRHLEINGGTVNPGPPWHLRLPVTHKGYTDAQIDDYGRIPSPSPSPSQAKQKYSRRAYPWRPGVRLHLRARFSHAIGRLIGTAGFGFWNAPFGDPTVRWPALPQATWFFYASEPTDLPLAQHGVGRGWFAATLDATTPSALMMAPLAPLVLLLNQSRTLRHRIWPTVQHRLGISYQQLDNDITQWHDYDLHWLPNGCSFQVNGRTVLQTPFSPRGPLGFVCWLDNQYLVVTANGRFRWGTLPIPATQWLEIDNLQLESHHQ